MTYGQLARLFQPFERLDAPLHGIEGNGLGLVVSKALLEAMDGTIDVASSPGSGSVFSIRLLAAEAVAAEAGARGADARAPAPDAGAGRLTTRTCSRVRSTARSVRPPPPRPPERSAVTTVPTGAGSCCVTDVTTLTAVSTGVGRGWGAGAGLGWGVRAGGAGCGEETGGDPPFEPPLPCVTGGTVRPPVGAIAPPVRPAPPPECTRVRGEPRSTAWKRR